MCIFYFQPDANFIMASCQPSYSDEGTSKRTLEQDIINHFQDYLQELEDDGKYGTMNNQFIMT